MFNKPPNKPIVYTEKKLYQYGINKLATQEYSRQELFKKMKWYQTDLSMINQVLDRLEEKKYLSDERRAKVLLNQYQHREGIKKIEHRLTDKGIKKEIITPIITAIKEENYLEETQRKQAFELLLRKYKVFNNDNYQKMTGFLLRKGFAFADASKALKDFKNYKEE